MTPVRMVAAAILVLACTLTTAARAQEPPSAPPTATSPIRIDREVGALRELSLEVGQNRLLVLSEQIVRVSVADPKVADLKVITPTQLLLTARGAGTTDLTMWNKRDEPLVMALQVARNLEALRKQLATLFPGEKITVYSTGDLVVLSGEVTDVRIPERAAEVAQLHVDKLANLIKVVGDQQVQLEVKFAEVSRRGLRQMGWNFFHIDSLGRAAGGLMPPPASNLNALLPVPGTSAGGPPPIYPPNHGEAFSVFFSSFPRFPFSTAVSLLESTGLAKILAEPTLVALSGQEAKFLAGGEFPVPISSQFGQVGVLWKKFGILLNFTPTVIGQETIQLRMAAEVSDVDPARQIVLGGFIVPGLTSRQSETTVRLADGQSFAIAGLLSNKIRSQIDKVPLLGDIPILGMLFRSVDYRRDESELLVVVTARLAKPLAPHEVPPLPTDEELNDPSDFALFLLGSEGRDKPEKQEEEGREPAPAAPANGEQRAPQASLGNRGPSGPIGFIR